ncbi:hypothetical protein PINS_up004807 [Pythium insidiosum]|nr:hypothetical protein PINS_up004807 [Pythium insidiosum]
MRVFSSPLVPAAALVVVSVLSPSTSGVADAQELINGVRLYGINYNPRKDAHWLPNWQACKNDWEVRQDFDMLRRLTDRVRIYGLADCEQGRQVVTLAKQYGLQVHLGLWTSKDRGTFDADFSRLQNLVNDGLIDGNIVGIHVGSEAIYREDVDANTAIDYMRRVRDLLRGRQINTPITITDVVDVYYNNPQLVDAVDYVSVNQFSFWEKKEPAEAVTSTLNRLRAIRDLAASKNKDFVLSETGWATAGANKDTSETSNEASAEFFRNFYHQARSRDLKYYYFGSFDANWRLKESGKEVEIHFGLIYEDRNLKEPFRNFNTGRRELLNIRARTTGLLVAEELAGGDMAHVKEFVRLAEPSDNWLEREQAGWFFDRDTRQIRSQHDDRCLDAYQPQNGGGRAPLEVSPEREQPEVGVRRRDWQASPRAPQQLLSRQRPRTRTTSCSCGSARGQREPGVGHRQGPAPGQLGGARAAHQGVARAARAPRQQARARVRRGRAPGRAVDVRRGLGPDPRQGLGLLYRRVRGVERRHRAHVAVQQQRAQPALGLQLGDRSVRAP